MKHSILGRTMLVMVLPPLVVSAPVMAAALAKADAAEKARAEAAAKGEAEKARVEAATKAEQARKELKSEPERRDDAEKHSEDAKAKRDQLVASKAEAKRDEKSNAEKSKNDRQKDHEARKKDDDEAKDAAEKDRHDRDSKSDAAKPVPAELAPKPEAPAPGPVPIPAPTPAPVPPSAPPQRAISNAGMPTLISAFGRAGAPDPGPARGQTMLVSFDAPNAFGVRDISSGTVLTAAGSIGGVRAAPAGNTGVYRSLGGASQSTFDFSGWTKGAPLASFSFEWGSMDSYNFVDFLDKKGDTVWTLSGSDLPQFNGDQSAPITNQRLFVTFQKQAQIAAVRMRSNGAAFEFDSLAGAAATGAVPEPASWVMLIVGFGFVGHGLRKRRTGAVSA